MTLKFKNRIALFNTVAVALTTALIFIVIYFDVDKTAYNHLDGDINLEKEEVLNNLDWHADSIIINKMPEWDEAEHKQIEVNPTFLQITDLKGRIVFRSSNLVDDQFLDNPHNNSKVFLNGEVSDQKIRLGQFPIKNESGKTIGLLMIGVSRQESYNILSRLIWILFLSFPIVLIVQFMASSFAASSAIKPVHQLIKTTSEISDTNIGMRLTLPEHKDELYELATTINDLLARIEKSIFQQKQFTSDASHEIRTPLSAIRGTLEVLIRKHREPELYKEKITGVIQQVDRLDGLLEQLLQLARIDSSYVVVKNESINLAQIIVMMKIKWAPAATERNINLHMHIADGPVVFADKFYLEVILDNLINNAIKYGRENGNIYLSWDNAIKSLSIIDDGIGIAPEYLPNIFNRFYRADESRSSQVRGYGLGLSIVKKLADLQHISLNAVSQPGIGSTFILQFHI